MTSLKSILVPVDFSAVTPTVVQTATSLAKRSGLSISLLHVKHIKSAPDVDQKLVDLAGSVAATHNIACTPVIRSGSIFAEVKQEASAGNHDFAVIGSHGFKGIRELMFGADILKLLKLISIPALTVLKDYSFPEKGFQKIVLPVASHNSFHLIVNAVIKIAGWFNSEVTIYSVEKPELKWSDRLIANINLAESELKKAAVQYTRVNEPQSQFSLGYSKQTLEFASRIQADLIALMSVPAKEHFYFADGDKEQIITNRFNIPVISTSDRI